MRYTIKRISELVGIAPQTIRYYEEKGMLSPEKNEKTGYRYYTVWDYGILLTARKYLRYGCTVAQSAELLNDIPLEASVDMAKEQEAKLQAEITDSLRVLENLRTWRTRLEQTPLELNRCRIERRPAMLRLENMDDITFYDDAEVHRRTKEWLSMTPFVFNTVRYPLEDVQNDTGHRVSGQGLLEADARRLGIVEDAYVRYYPERMCVCMTIGGKNFDTMLPLSRRISGGLRYLEENGLTLTGDILTRTDFVQKCATGYRSYQTAWLPVD